MLDPGESCEWEEPQKMSAARKQAIVRRLVTNPFNNSIQRIQ